MKLLQYELLAELGKGQFGDVSLAVGEVPGRHGAPARRRLVAIKRLRESRNAESERLLRQEFALLDQVKHRAVVRVFEYLAAERAVVMEYVHGVTLRTILDDCARAREQVFTEAAIEIGCEVADALYQAYTTPGDNGERLSLVHRDLKPENIMLTSEGEVKLLDFGLARVENSDFAVEDASRVRGTPLYMAPEQARGEAIDHRTDLFALGLILYELLMGRPAHRVADDSAGAVAAAFRAIEAGSLEEQCRELESKLPGMGPVVARLLQTNPRNRYPNGQDLLVDLRRQLYRDRGSYIKEFVSFYFGSLHPIGPPPDPDAPRGGRMSTEKRKSMEERLADSMVDPSDPAPRAPVPVRRAVKPAVSPTPAAAPPPVAPVRTSAPPKITPRSAPAARTDAPLPPDDELPLGVRGARPGANAAPPPPKPPIGARSPSENGMLQMVPLRNEDEQEASADPSATAFFAIPAPRADRPKASAPPPAASPSFQPPSSGARPSAPAPFAPPPPGSAPMPTPAPQPAAGGGVGLGSAGQIGLGNAGRPTPFQSSGPPPNQGNSDESRMQSTRVFALVFAALAMVCMATVLAGGVVWWRLSQEEVVAAPVTVATAPVAPPKPAAADTGLPQAAPKPSTTKAKPKPSSGGGTAPAPTPRASATGTVSVSFSGASIPTKIEVACDNGFQQRVSLSGGAGSVSGVPTSGTCKMHLKGGVVATPATVRGGGTYSCSVTGTTTVCK